MVVARLRAAGCVFAEDEARLLLESAGPVPLAELVDRRVAGLPLEQVLGWAEFRGLRVAVEPGVFVPRRRTGFLVECAVAEVWPGAVVVDLCCGSGAVGAALVAESAVRLYAADVDPAAVRCARRNVDPDRVFEGDLFAALPDRLRGRLDVVVANAPYVPTSVIGTMPPEARDHEPLVALDGGHDGLAVQRRVVADAPAWLAPGGALLVETGERLAPGTLAAFRAAGFDAAVRRSAEVDATVVVGRATRRPPRR
ncbi:Methyltransferase [Saccharothrix espanaensis DSM 44229]|uniref:peptide chain release factor N(5)-glutamine methyltransferase n=1 Tax=Saccharothrix espanaensis (strain ATCC 51144 / DSM 44229 / JCM 9112 / NBRC 15066 / NRRL 15764) TaxID=1179773 RepID=K0K1L4_SACES|nr:Methyltransferase [Saccharothrix espanaensis DSM 44229]